jgi:hypothetical protein
VEELSPLFPQNARPARSVSVLHRPSNRAALKWTRTSDGHPLALFEAHCRTTTGLTIGMADDLGGQQP